ncbi:MULTISPECIES: hypothetical protein [Candidatus Nitrosocaldus]|jgi:hypothetical protein|uniref:Uncharacterized protein n=1 Tax=Candidatus Nitrosocaldus cavascurensis TaxID=2058097 RepID=A0A2K5ASH1_9ARCH|nr:MULTISPECIES: hypothetical protein [Candidatus Nitrosocaldus]GBC74153.1 hypothetical protein HRbin05_00187 [archaeon HR05]SPC34590.1 protein of unknown function [Candidatus Nitrosocaldus cavascurensis]
MGMGHARYVFALTMMSFSMAIVLAISAIIIDYYILGKSSSVKVDIREATDDLIKGNVLKSIINELSKIAGSDVGKSNGEYIVSN